MDELHLAQYNSLRSEILQSQQTRIVILGFVLVAFGTAAGFALGKEAPREIEFVAGLAGVEFLLVLSAVNTTVVLTHRIELIAAFLRRQCEEPGMWENWLAAARQTEAKGSKLKAVLSAAPPLNTSRSLAVIYALMTIAAVLVYFGGAHGDHTCFSILVPVVGFVVNAVAISQLWRRPWDLDAYFDDVMSDEAAGS